MSERKTPQTDSEEFIVDGEFDGRVVKSDFARRLERERDAAVEALKIGMEIGDGCSRGFLAKFQAQARAVLREIEGES